MAAHIGYRLPGAADQEVVTRLFAAASPGREFLPPALLAFQEGLQRRQWTVQWGVHGETLVELDGLTAARIWVVWTAEGVRLVDLTILPEFRRRGLARRLVSGLCDAADAAGAPFALSMHTDNPVAHRLYESLGFTPGGDPGRGSPGYVAMARAPRGYARASTPATSHDAGRLP